VSGPGGASAIHAGDQISVTVPIHDDTLVAYSCFGLSSEQSLIGGMELLYGVAPAYVRSSGQVPPGTKPGTVMHFSAVASGTAYAPTDGAACSDDLTQMDFDVTVE
jgi:hypothetical protein